MRRPPHAQLCELVISQLRILPPGQQILFVDTDVQVRSIHNPEFDPVLLQHERQYWEDEGSLLAVVFINAEGMGGATAPIHTVVEYLPNHTTYTVISQRVDPNWEDEPDQIAVEAMDRLFMKGGDT